VFEIDFLPVGDGETSGDAIAMRFTRPDGELAQIIVDGGFKDDGEALVEHVHAWYGTDTFIDYVFCTHPDKDHIGGLPTVLEELPVGALVIHDLAAHGGARLPAAQRATELIEAATARGIPWCEGFAGAHAFGGALMIAGPSVEFLEGQVRAEKVKQLVEASIRAGEAPPGHGALAKALRDIQARNAAHPVAVVPEETDFDDDGGTTPCNNRSMILDIRVDSQRIMLTSDAGVPALNGALDVLADFGRNDRYPDVVQVPHHGSRHNMDTSTAMRRWGNPDQLAPLPRRAVVSATKDAPKHPSLLVTNALIRRGYTVGVTEDRVLCVPSWDAPNRGWPSIAPVPPMSENLAAAAA
jgi:beta-lactamase superfamily II metal-dependent hydrolase